MLTGTLTSMTREQEKQKIKDAGGNINESVSRKTDFVIVGQNPGSKYTVAKNLNVTILEEKEFIDLIAESR